MALKIAKDSETHKIAEGSRPAREMLHEKISAILKRNLMMGRFKPGQKLPLRSLAHLLGTSLIPVRDALQRLEGMGCIVSSVNRTMMVPIYTPKELNDIRDLRMMLEAHAAAEAAVNRSQAELKAMHRFCNDIGRSAKTANLDLFLEANYKFHMAIAAASHIAFISTLLEPLWIRIGPSIRQAMPSPKHMANVVAFHNDIYEAILHNDAEGARNAIKRDIFDGNADTRSVRGGRDSQVEAEGGA
jgi:DNA-binding GntR family transcriptional regulator